MDFSEYQSNLDAFNNAKEQLGNLVDEGRELISGKQSVKDKIATVLQQGGDIGGSVLGGLGTIAEITKGTALEKTIGSLKDQLTTLRQNVVDGVQKGVESGIDKATTAARNIAGDNPTVNSMIDSASSATRQTLTTATNQAAGGDFSGALNTVQSGGSQALTTGSQAVQSGIKAATDAGTELVQAGTRAASDAVAGASTTVNQTVAMAGNAGARAASSITGNEIKLNLGNVGKSLTRSVKGTKQIKQSYEPTTSEQPVAQTVPNQPPQLGKALGEGESQGLPELPDFPGLTDIFGLVPKSTVVEAESAAANLAPKVGSAEATVSELGGAIGRLGEVSGVAKTTSDALIQAPSKVLGIANKGMRGDSTIARALRINQSEKPVSVKPSEPARPVSTEEMKMPTMEEYETRGNSFSDPSETLLSKYLPEGRTMDSIGDIELNYIATGISKADLAAARASEGQALIQSSKITSSSLDNQAPQARISAPEPSAQPQGAQPSQTTGTPNNPILNQPKSSSSEIEPAIGPEPKPSSAPVASPKSASSAEGGEATEAGEIAAGGEAAVEGGAALGPEGLLVGALVAGVSSLIGGLIKDFEPSKPSTPTYTNTGVSFANQAQMTSGTAF